MQTADATLDLSDRIVPPLDRGQRLFRIALAAAFLLHAAFFIEVGRSLPRTIGDRTGAPDAIAVDLVSAADLASRETVAMPPAGAPTAQPPTPAPEVPPEPAEAAPPPPPPEPPPQAKPEPAEPAPPAPAEKQAETLPPAETKAPEKAETPALPKDFASELPDLATMPQPPPDPPAAPEPKPKAAEAAPPAEAAAPPKSEQQAPAKKKAEKQARLDPAPPDVRSAPPGRSASATRPPGITRSGENDEFGRGVVRALRMTMPPPRGIMGRVTVRLILTPNGDLQEVRVLDPSRTTLDQSVVFATQQTYFPLPPYNSTVADRTFVITYVYR